MSSCFLGQPLGLPDLPFFETVVFRRAHVAHQVFGLIAHSAASITDATASSARLSETSAKLSPVFARVAASPDRGTTRRNTL
jgi:hypothetical protein